MARSQGSAFIDRLLPLMASGEAGIRSAVVKILLEMEDRHELVKRYLKFSKTLAGWARDRALDSMREFGEDLVEPTVELLSDPDEEICGLALAVVGAFEDPRIIPATVELLGAEDWWLRICAADTLGQFKDPRAVDALMAALDDPEARWAAVEALGRIGDPQCLPRLSKLLNDPAPEVRIEVLLAFPKFDHPKVLEALQRVARSDPHRSVRARALEIAESLGVSVRTVERMVKDYEPLLPQGSREAARFRVGGSWQSGLTEPYRHLNEAYAQLTEAYSRLEKAYAEKSQAYDHVRTLFDESTKKGWRGR